MRFTCCPNIRVHAALGAELARQHQARWFTSCSKHPGSRPFRRASWRNGRRYMSGLTDAEIDAALARGQAARQAEPRATTAQYDRRYKRVVIGLTNGCTFSFPPRLAQG